MSGIAGIVTLDNQPLDKDLLNSITTSMTFRGPDAFNTWSSQNVGLGHTLLRTTWQSINEKQPLTLDQKTWLTADARLDGRKELIAKLQRELDRYDLQPNEINDAQLILCAYSAWGDECVRHLIGDFAFGIYDSSNQLLLCARDHFGIKPFYYARCPGLFLFSNTLKSIQLHPRITSALNDQVIGDLLLFDFNRDSTQTAFKEICRLPPAHTYSLDLTSGESVVKRFWTVPEDVTLRYRRQSEYLEHFQELFTRAVEDRICTDTLQSYLSGGLDSTGIASVVVQTRKIQNREPGLTGQCVVYRELMNDTEGHFASIAARALGIPIYYIEADRYLLYQDAGSPELSKPEPVHEPLQKLSYDQFSAVCDDSRVVLSGLGPDATIAFWLHSHISALKDKNRWGELTLDLMQYFWLKRRPPRLHLAQRFRPKEVVDVDFYPRWFNKDFEERLELRNRKALIDSAIEGNHFRREMAFRYMNDQCGWQYHFEYSDSGVTQLPFEVRYPYFDVRLVSYLMSIPAIPWCVDKRLLRETVKNVLPPEIYERPKTPLAADAFTSRIERGENPWAKMGPPNELLHDYVDVDKFQTCVAERPQDSWVNMRPISLNLWLQEKEQML